MSLQKNEIMPKGEMIIYQTADGQASIDVKMENETVWLTSNQMALLFGRDEKTIRKHVNNVFKDDELERERNTHFLRVPLSDKPVAFYNLDVIISVGYRVKSPRGTQFRIWVNRVLKEYLVRGYAINNKLAAQKYEELSQLVQILGRTIQSQPELTNKENSDLVAIVTNYNYALDTLDNYDYERLTIQDTTPEERFHATLFLWFMHQNGLLYHPDGSKRISDGTLVALTLMIAESRTEEKDVMVKVVVNLINQRN